jgi:hypothetical protein
MEQNNSRRLFNAKIAVFLLFLVSLACPMRPKARRLAQHGGPPGWLEESDPGVILYVMDETYRLPFPYRTGCPDRS